MRVVDVKLAELLSGTSAQQGYDDLFYIILMLCLSQQSQHSCSYRYDKQYHNDDFYNLFEVLLRYEHWVFASPVYWYNTTPKMKAFIDRITDYMDDEALKPKLRTLRQKQFSLLSNAASPSAPDAFIDMFKHTFNYLGMTFKAHSHVQAS